MNKQEAVKDIHSKAGVPLTWCKEAYDKCGGTKVFRMAQGTLWKPLGNVIMSQ